MTPIYLAKCIGINYMASDAVRRICTTAWLQFQFWWVSACVLILLKHTTEKSINYAFAIVASNTVVWNICLLSNSKWHTHYELMREDCELCYSCDYCKKIRQMAARTRRSTENVQWIIITRKNNSCCLTFIITTLTFQSEKRKVLLQVLALVHRIPNTR